MTKFERLLEAVPDALVGMDQKGMIRFVNRQTEWLFGYDRDELIGGPIEMLVPEPLWQIYASHREDYFADSRTRSSGLDVELIGRHHNGLEFPVNISMSHIDTGDVLLVITAVRDVAQQKLAVKNAELIAAIVQYSDDAIVGSTLEGVVTSWNPAAERMYGYSSKEIIGRSASLLAPEDRAGELEANLARVKGGEAVEGLETMSVRKDGSVVPVSVTVAPIHDEGGEIVGASAVHRDVTEHRRAFEIAQRMEAIVESSNDAIIGKTDTGIITSWNPAAERMYGYSGQEIIGKSIELLSPKGRSGEIEGILAKVKAGQVVERSETERVRKDGTVFPVSLTVSPIRDSDGVVIGASTITRDITELRQAVARAQELFEVAPDALVEVDQDGVIRSVNRQTELVFGYDRDELVGQMVETLMPESFRAVHPGHRASYGADPVVRPMGADLELAGRRRDGTEFPVEISLSPVRTKDGLLVTAAVRDVTEHRRVFEIAQRMEAIVESSNDAIIGETVTGIITSWNAAAETMYGYAGEEVIGKSISVLIPKDLIEEMDAILARIKAGQEVERLETIRVRRDGTQFPVSVTVSPIRDLNGAIVGASAIQRDVTDQRRAFEEAQRMKALVESSEDAIVGQTVTGIITSWNAAAETMYGYAREEIIGKSISVLIPKDRSNEMEAVLARIRAGRDVERLATIRVRKDGTVFPISLSVSPICDHEGAIVGASGIGRDMTEQEHAAQYARSLIEANLDALVAISPEGKINDVNEAVVKITGCPREALIGSEYAQYVTEPDKATEVFQEVFEQGSVTDYPLTVRHRDGTLTDVICNLALYRDTGGNVLGVFASGRDVTKQKEAFEVAERLAAIVEGSGDAIISCSVDGNISSWNPAAERMFGFSREEILGRPAEILAPEDGTHEVKALLAKIGAGRRVEHLEIRCVQKDGRLFPVSLTVSPIHDSGGALVGASVIYRERTEKEKE